MDLMLCLTCTCFVLGLKHTRHSHLYHVFLKDSVFVKFSLYEEPLGFLIFRYGRVGNGALSLETVSTEDSS